MALPIFVTAERLHLHRRVEVRLTQRRHAQPARLTIPGETQFHEGVDVPHLSAIHIGRIAFGVHVARFPCAGLFRRRIIAREFGCDCVDTATPNRFPAPGLRRALGMCPQTRPGDDELVTHMRSGSVGVCGLNFTVAMHDSVVRLDCVVVADNNFALAAPLFVHFPGCRVAARNGRGGKGVKQPRRRRIRDPLPRCRFARNSGDLPPPRQADPISLFGKFKHSQNLRDLVIVYVAIPHVDCSR